MRKVWALTLKELLTVARDRTGLLLLLAAPLGLTFVLSFALGGLGGGGLAPVPIAVVNRDEGPIGSLFMEVLGSDELGALVSPTTIESADEARARVDADAFAAAVVVPPNLTARLYLPAGDPARVELYTNPGRPTGSLVARGIVARIVQGINASATAVGVSMRQIVASGRLTETQVMALAPELGQRVAMEAAQHEAVTVRAMGVERTAEGQFDYPAYYAPSMAILFLMIAMISAGRALLTERDAGTLARLRASPTPAAQIMLGKLSGVLWTGLLQMAILIGATSLLMGVNWGQPLAVAVHTLLVVAATAALGMIIATLARTPQQAGVMGSGVVMALAALGGNFVPRLAYPQWMQRLSLIGPNAWGIQGYQRLAAGASLGDLISEVAALSAMTVVFMGVALWGFRRVL